MSKVYSSPAENESVLLDEGHRILPRTALHSPSGVGDVLAFLRSSISRRLERLFVCGQKQKESLSRFSFASDGLDGQSHVPRHTGSVSGALSEDPPPLPHALCHA